jgi:hypothetical protein
MTEPLKIYRNSKEQKKAKNKTKYTKNPRIIMTIAVFFDGRISTKHELRRKGVE